VLLSSLRERSQHCQILVTSHSPDLLDNSDIPTESILAVDNQDGLTRIGHLDEAGRSMLRDKLFTPGQLLRQNHLAPDSSTLSDVSHERQLNLFECNGRRDRRAGVSRDVVPHRCTFVARLARPVPHDPIFRPVRKRSGTPNGRLGPQMAFG